MMPSTIQPKKIVLLVSFLQIALLFSYFSLNIKYVGQLGVYLPLLIGFTVLAGFLLLTEVFRFTLVIRLHLWCFLLLVSWISLRVVVDLGDLEHLKQLTIATTGGMMLFFFIGVFVRQALERFNEPGTSTLLPKLLLFLFFLFIFGIFLSFKGRLDRADIFYIEGVEDGYQRPGNFLIMMFITVSFIYLGLAAHPLTKSFMRLSVWLVLYSIGLLLALISSQMMGSNAATANVLAIYMMTSTISMLAISPKLRNRFHKGHLALPLSKVTLKKLCSYSGVALLVCFLLAMLAVHFTGFDLNKTRAFGFGSGNNSSIVSRFDILVKEGVSQLGYAPFFGNVNVATLTTGVTGRTLHNFIPNVLAELGMIGLTLVLFLLILTFRTVINEIRNCALTPEGFKKAFLNFWLMFVLIWLFIYANLSVGKSWPVIWFAMGFVGNVFVFYKGTQQIE